MRRFVKIASTVLICSFMLLMFSCAAKEVETVPEYEEEYDEENYDFKGYEFFIRALTHGSQYALNPNLGEEASGDKLLQRYRDTEKEFNITINVQNGIDMSEFNQYLASGYNYADLMLNVQREVVQNKMMQDGYYISYTELGLDFDSGMYGSPTVLQANTFKGEVYGITAYYWNIPVADTMPAMWFNQYTLDKFSQPNPHELDENGQWNWATFKNICGTVLDTSDPDKNNHIYAACYTSEPYLELAAVFSNNGRFVELQDDGTLKYSLNSQNTIQALEFLADLVQLGYIGNGGDRQNIEPFLQDKRAFFFEYTHLGASSESRENFTYLMEHAYEWINFPAGPMATDDMISTSYSYHSRYFYSPITADAEVLAAVLPYMFQPLPGDTVETYLDDFKTVNFYTEESYEYFLDIRNNAFFDYSVYTPYDARIKSQLKNVVTGKSTAVEALSSLESSVQEMLDDLWNDYID